MYEDKILKHSLTNEKKDILKKILLLIIIAFFIEVIVFNITSYRILFGNYEKKELKEFNFLYNQDGKAFIEFPNLNMKIGTVNLLFENIKEVTEYKIYFSDDTSSEYNGLNSKKYIPSYNKSKYMPLYLSGNTRGLVVSFDSNIYEDGNFKGIIVNDEIPFEFNIIRFIVLFGIMMSMYFFNTLKIFNENYSYFNMKQEVILLLILAIFFVILTFINTYSANENENKVYNELFVNALGRKQVYLIEKPSDEFMKLEDPYDDLARRELKRNEDYLWDTSYYNGKQYIYFGILPVLISFLPYHLLTGKYLQISIVIFVFSILVLILLKEILTKIIKIFFAEVEFKIVVYSLIMLCSGSLILYLNGIPRVYELVIIAGLYFVLQGLYFILKSVEFDRKKYLNIFLGSLCLALSVACRPTDLFASLLILPYLIYMLIQDIKNYKENKKAFYKLIFAVGIPYITVGLSLMYYNYIRFGNVFEFGAKYQLTITNMAKLGSRVFSIPVGMVTNLFSIPNFILKFPFIVNHNNLIEFYGYYYIENMIGGVFIIAPICFMNFKIAKVNQKIQNKKIKILINSLLIVGLFIAVLSVAMAGSNQRYLVDYAWMIILSGILIFITIYNSLKTDEGRKIYKKVFAVITVYTFLIGIFSGIVSEKSYLKNKSPEIYYKTEYTVCFWE